MSELDKIFEEFETEKEEEEEKKETPKQTEEPKQVEEPKQEAKKEEVPVESAVEDFFGTTEEELKEEEEIEEVTRKKEIPEEVKKMEFDVSEDKGRGKLVYCIYGLKGEGKTYLAFTFPGRIACLSFDRKSVMVREKHFKNDGGRIVVFDAIRYMDYNSPENLLISSEKSFRYLNKLLDFIEANIKPDWIIIDGTEILQRIAEMTMRYRNDLMPFQGVKNRNLWKERRMYLTQIHNRCLSIANRGVIYTTYTDKDEIIKDGEFVTKTDVPKWIGAILYETDTIIRVEARTEKGTRRFYAIVESSKSPDLRTGRMLDITNKGFQDLVEKEG